MSVHARYAVLAALLLTAVAEAQDASAPRRLGTFADSGLYVCGRAAGGRLCHRRVGLGEAPGDEFAAVRRAGGFSVVQLEGDWRGGDPEATRRRLRDWLAANDLSGVDVLVLGEEQPYDAPGKLAHFYEEFRAHGIPAYYWPTFPLGPTGLGDGSVYDAYGDGYRTFRHRVVSFLGTGKPLIVCIDGSGYSDIGSAREQVMVCREFDLPAFYFVADSGSGSYNNWYGKSAAPLVPWRNFVFSAMEFQRRDLPAGDFVWGEPVELTADAAGHVGLSWTGIGSATVYGFSHLNLRDGKLKAVGSDPVNLDYQVWSLLPLQEGRLILTTEPPGGSGIRVEVSRCGKFGEWKELAASASEGGLVYALPDAVREIRLRITLAGQNAAAIAACRLTGTMSVPAERAIDLDSFLDGWRGVRYTEDFSAGRWRALGSIDAPENLAHRQLALAGRAGHGVSVAAVQKFTSGRPLESIVIRLRGSCNPSNLGGTFLLGVSLDGKEILRQVSPTDPPDGNGTIRGTCTLDLKDFDAFRGVRSFYVHMIQSNGSGVATNVSSSLERLEIDATPR